jgi:HKD family nuclease
LSSWLELFKQDKNELWSAVTESNKIADAILIQEKEYLQSQVVSTRIIDELLVPVVSMPLELDNYYENNL